MQLVDAYTNAIPKALEDSIGKVVAKAGVVPVSVYRGDEAAPILNRHGKHTQRQIYNATPAERILWGILGNPNRPGQSTHECCSDGVAYRGPVGRRLADWQCGMDWPDLAIWRVISAFKANGDLAFHPYASGVEYHHVNLLKAPKIAFPFLPLHPSMRGRYRRQSSGLWVYILTGRLKNCGYLKNRTSVYDNTVFNAVSKYQTHHHMAVDGICGEHTWVSVKASERWCKQHHRTEV